MGSCQLLFALVPDAAPRAACRIAHVPDVASRVACHIVHVLDASSLVCLPDGTYRATDCFFDAPDAASLAQHVRLCLPVMIFSELIVVVFVPDSAFMSVCCNFHALTSLPGLCVALLMPLMLLLGLCVV